MEITLFKVLSGLRSWLGGLGKLAVAENFGLIGSSFRSIGEEYADQDSVEPRLYLLVRLIIEASREAE